MKFNSTEANKIDVQWNSEYGLAYILAVFLVQKKTSEDLLNRLKAKAVRDADHTKRMSECKSWMERIEKKEIKRTNFQCKIY